ncbi:pyroglutamyl-peptidase I [Demequina sp. B12]|uniref:pyroglutamyl-peptidase I n=1 Tax=Demequina sp. B12 TaxID=2992757 RepID=UPI00237A6FE1|nr:pyroglutamyl-peptidase I [Demequina sp. B12]MDE0573136.1 pyroglutamyl-peptidase I [Demequina sp. B12]
MTTVLLTGFEPFAGAERNPSWEIARSVAHSWRGDATVVAERLPVEFTAAPQRLAEALVQHQPDVVIALGLAEGRPGITPEKVAINTMDARIPDNAGAQPIDADIVADAPTAYFTTLPIKAMVAAINECGVAASVSYTAGTYVCNQIFYSLQHALRGTHVASGFIHVPLDEPANDQTTSPAVRPWVPLDQQVAAISAALAVVVRGDHELKTNAGTLH